MRRTFRFSPLPLSFSSLFWNNNFFFLFHSLYFQTAHRECTVHLLQCCSIFLSVNDSQWCEMASGLSGKCTHSPWLNVVYSASGNFMIISTFFFHYCGVSRNFSRLGIIIGGKWSKHHSGDVLNSSRILKVTTGKTVTFPGGRCFSCNCRWLFDTRYAFCRLPRCTQFQVAAIVIDSVE